MNDARKERLLREVLGPNRTEVPFPERTLVSLGAIAFILLTVAALTPSRDAREAVAISAIEAHAATIVRSAPPAAAGFPAASAEPSAQAAEGNVQDMTY
jgi:hypothetical protein